MDIDLSADILDQTFLAVRRITAVNRGGDSGAHRIEESDNRVDGGIAVIETTVKQSLRTVERGEFGGIENRTHRLIPDRQLSQTQFQIARGVQKDYALNKTLGQFGPTVNPRLGGIPLLNNRGQNNLHRADQGGMNQDDKHSGRPGGSHEAPCFIRSRRSAKPSAALVSPSLSAAVEADASKNASSPYSSAAVAISRTPR